MRHFEINNRWRLNFNGKGKAKVLRLGDFLFIVKRESFREPRQPRWYFYIIREDFRDERLKVRVR